MKDLKSKKDATFGELLIMQLILFLVAPTLLGIGLSLLGMPLDWHSWKTYFGLVLVTAALRFGI